MSSLNFHDENRLIKMSQNWRDHNWDPEASIDWSAGIDFNKPLVSLDEHAFFFPGASKEQRLAISQMMGLLIAASIFEMEESLIRIKSECFLKPFDRYPVGPEFLNLGEQFFAEEVKHSEVFKRYFYLFSEKLGVDPVDFLAILPQVRSSNTEAILKFHANQGGHAFWWIVAIVEQEFLEIYRKLKPHAAKLDPLYYKLHQLHFEEEMRHAPFPLMMLDFLNKTENKPLHYLFGKFDLVTAQILQGTWTLLSIRKLRKIKKFKGKDPFFDILIDMLPQMEQQNTLHIMYKLFTQTPYVSTFVNPEGTAKILKFAKDQGKFSLPFPGIDTSEAVDY